MEYNLSSESFIMVQLVLIKLQGQKEDIEKIESEFRKFIDYFFIINSLIINLNTSMPTSIVESGGKK